MDDGKLLGSGQSGEVLAVEGEDVVIKRYVPSKTYTADQFRQEIVNARIAHAIIPDGSPEVFESDEDEKSERPWFAMKRVRPLYGTYPRKTVVAYILRLIGLCIRLREAGWLHGDIKVENLCLVNGRLGLIDFASMMPVEVANTHDVRTGSDFYRAPETDCDRIVDERTEIHAIAVTFIKLASRSAIVRYAVPLVRSLMPFPWLRYQTFEDFSRGIEREPKRFNRLVWISAAVWKTRIVAHKTALTVGTIAVIILVIVYTDFRDSRNRHRERRQPRIDVKTLVGDGYIAYRTGEMKTARDNLEAAMSSPEFRIEDYSYFDFIGFYKDVCETTVNKTLPRVSNRRD